MQARTAAARVAAAASEAKPPVDSPLEMVYGSNVDGTLVGGGEGGESGNGGGNGGGNRGGNGGSYGIGNNGGGEGGGGEDEGEEACVASTLSILRMPVDSLPLV